MLLLFPIREPVLERYIRHEDRRHPASDAYFPNLDSLPDWEQASSEKFSSGGLNCEFCVYEKVK